MANQMFAQSNETNCLNVFSSCIPGADLVQTWLMESPEAIFDESSGGKMSSEDDMDVSADGSRLPFIHHGCCLHHDCNMLCLHSEHTIAFRTACVHA